MIQACNQAAPAGAAAATTPLPEWDLGDLYASPDAPEVDRDLRAALEAARALQAEYKGRLGELDGAALAKLIASYAQLLHAARTDDPEIGRFFQTVQERVNEAATSLLFVTLELNKIEDEA